MPGQNLLGDCNEGYFKGATVFTSISGAVSVSGEKITSISSGSCPPSGGTRSETWSGDASGANTFANEFTTEIPTPSANSFYFYKSGCCGDSIININADPAFEGEVTYTKLTDPETCEGFPPDGTTTGTLYLTVSVSGASNNWTLSFGGSFSVGVSDNASGFLSGLSDDDLIGSHSISLPGSGGYSTWDFDITIS